MRADNLLPFHPSPPTPSSPLCFLLVRVVLTCLQTQLVALVRYEFGRWTIISTSLGDVNTDSNTRQRDNCEMDAFIAAMGQRQRCLPHHHPTFRENAASPTTILLSETTLPPPPP